MIRDNDLLLVSITNQSSMTISEDTDISLLLTLSDTINRNLLVTLNYNDGSGLAPSAPTIVNVPSGMTTRTFIVPIIDDEIVAQSTRNINISVITGMGYTASTDSVTVNVIDNDTATVSILPVRTAITGGDDAEFEVVLGLVTAVNIDIGIDVAFGGSFITDEDRGSTTVTVRAGQTSALLTVPTMENTGAENSSLVATLIAVSHTDLTIGDPSSARVEISALSPLSITATPDMLSLVEGGASKEINVSLNRIPEGSGSVTVMINLQEGSELTVSESSLEFTGTETRTVNSYSDKRW